ncbi:FecCD family ABC transporter permease [Helicovermis profundi]|uniref:Iron ABC transporter permease n=1 Tax=Helicovermis profundi TaxID=3065157 RepID=A0AAU9EFT9_9FIRM|nr:iron ABC transporter permease [Clostridia bacterium S502]
MEKYENFDDNIYSHIEREKKFNYLLILIFSVSLLLIIGISSTLGLMDISISEAYKIIIGKLLGIKSLVSGINETKVLVVWDVRLPRILAGAIVGSGLAVSGAVFQSILGNQLADPYTIGVSTGAAFGATIAIFLNLFFVSHLLPIMPFAFVFALLTLYIVTNISKSGGSISSSDVILSGIIISSILSAGISFLKTLAGEQVGAIVFWIMGSLSARSWTHIIISLPMVIVLITIIMLNVDELDIMALGKTEANNLGLDYEKKLKKYMIISSLLTATCVSISGVIGFVGLVVPHLVRMSISSRNRNVVLMSALLGGNILVIADNIARLSSSIEIPVGVFTTLLGGPFFMYIYIKRKRGITK